MEDSNDFLVGSYDMYGKKSKDSSKVLSEPTKRCFETHPELKILNGTVVGGSCQYPVRKDADHYIGLDSFGMYRGGRAYPWHPGSAFSFPIKDMHAPEEPEEFLQLIAWMVGELSAGRTVHVGCIGGHGRTGTVLAALVAVALEKKDAITWVRENYCKKAVESKEQVDFLMKYFDVKEVAPAKSYSSTMSSGLSSGSSWSKTGKGGHFPKGKSTSRTKNSDGTETDMFGNILNDRNEVIGSEIAKSVKSPLKIAPVDARSDIWLRAV